MLKDTYNTLFRFKIFLPLPLEYVPISCLQFAWHWSSVGAAIAAKKLLLSFLMLKKLCLFAGPLEGRSVPGRAGKVKVITTF